MLIKTHCTEELPSFDVVVCFSSAKRTPRVYPHSATTFYRTVGSSLSESWPRGVAAGSCWAGEGQTQHWGRSWACLLTSVKATAFLLCGFCQVTESSIYQFSNLTDSVKYKICSSCYKKQSTRDFICTSL